MKYYREYNKIYFSCCRKKSNASQLVIEFLGLSKAKIQKVKFFNGINPHFSEINPGEMPECKYCHKPFFGKEKFDVLINTSILGGSDALEKLLKDHYGFE